MTDESQTVDAIESFERQTDREYHIATARRCLASVPDNYTDDQLRDIGSRARHWMLKGLREYLGGDDGGKWAIEELWEALTGGPPTGDWRLIATAPANVPVYVRWYAGIDRGLCPAEHQPGDSVEAIKEFDGWSVKAALDEDAVVFVRIEPTVWRPMS